MRRYQLSGLEHIHMMRHIPRSYDMTRTHILHKGVNKHVDVVLRCSPKNRKKKKVAVCVVRSEKMTDAARIRANAKKGYVAVRKVVNEAYEADRKTAASAYEMKFGAKNPATDALIHDMKSQLSTMAKKSAEYIDDQLRQRPVQPVISYTEPTVPAAEETVAPSQPLISSETEEILKKGGYRLPNSPRPDNPYAADYLMHASNDEFHILMDSLKKSLDEACRKYAVEPVAPEVESENETYSAYIPPNEISLSVSKWQEITPDASDKPVEPPVETPFEYGEENFTPALTFTDGGEHYIPEDDLFDRELSSPEEHYVPPAHFFDDDEPSAYAEEDDSQSVSLNEYVPAPQPVQQQQEIFYTSDDEYTEDASDPDQHFADESDDRYPAEDYEQQQVFFPSDYDAFTKQPPYDPQADQEEFAQPTVYSDYGGEQDSYAGGDNDADAPMFFPDDGEDDMPPPMIFPDDEEDLPPPMLFPDDEEEEGYSPAPVSPDRNEYPDDPDAAHGVVDRSGETLFSRSGDQIRKVIGIIRGSAMNGGTEKNDAPVKNGNVEITYSRRGKYF